MESVVSRDQLGQVISGLKRDGKKIVFTNGCFDILHRGHVEYLTKAKALGDVLFVGMNTDASVRRLKGPSRPIVCQDDRAMVLAALRVVDYVCLFDEDTPYELIKTVVPDVLVKGSDWKKDAIVGKDIVEAAGGTVQTIEFVPNRSTTDIVKKIVDSITH
ncbi:MAG: D-glycero-beta-D-manno-heptose 1-phosphate adenylyltransferase [Ignavibacteriae bacterium]|nr:MAG: D-glycero-beta-D-manno-heptose 1-phosphate adenylyltransferase [Ignavibacteriota bacterium]